MPTGIYLLKTNNKNIKIRCEICSKLTIRHKNNANGVILVSLLLTMNIFHTRFGVSIVNFEHVIAGWEIAWTKSWSEPHKKPPSIMQQAFTTKWILYENLKSTVRKPSDLATFNKCSESFFEVTLRSFLNQAPA